MYVLTYLGENYPIHYINLTKIEQLRSVFRINNIFSNIYFEWFISFWWILDLDDQSYFHDTT